MDPTSRLRRRTPDALATLLRARPDVLVGRAPRTLDELAQRLASPPSVTSALQQLTAPHLQVFVAATALGGRPDLARLAALLDGDPRPQLRDLAALELLEFDEESVRVDPAVRRSVPDLLGLGPPFADIADAFPHRVLQRAAAGLGLPRTASKRAAVDALAAFYDDADRVRARATQLTPELVEDLVALAADEYLDTDPIGGFPVYDHWDRRGILARAALDTGLVLGSEGWGEPVVMPAEVSIALRGPRFRARFDPEPPPVSWLPVSRIGTDAAAAATRFHAAATAVLDQVAATPLPSVQSGGVGRRELQRLAKVTSEDVVTVTVVLELAAVAGLLAPGRPVVVTDAFAAWRDDEPAARYTALVQAWWGFPGRPGDQRDDEGNARRVFVGRRCDGCRSARSLMLRLLRTDAGLSGEDLGALAGWSAPGADAGDPPYEGHRQEAELLGVVAQGAITPIGAALRDGDQEALLAAAAGALPASTTTATFGSDLTVFVSGSPSSRVSLLLDSCATRESSGGAVTWRLSVGSVRRALDDGVGLADLRSALRGISAGGALPGAAEVLLDDVARVWGRARVRDAAGVVVSDDVALLAQLQHDRKLAKLGLQQVAPTVVLAAADGPTVLKALRAAGYLPAWDGVPDAGGAGPAAARPVVVRRPPAFARSPATGSATDPVELAHRLLDPGAAPPEVTVTEDAVRRWAPHLTDDEAAVLAAAVDDRDRVELVYESSTGGITERVVRPAQLLGDRVWAFCELRRDDREFVLTRILAVRPV